MNRRKLLTLIGSIPLIGWFVPKVAAEPVKIKRFVGDTGAMPPKFKWIMDGEIIENPSKTWCPNFFCVRTESLNPEWGAFKHMPGEMKIPDGYSWPTDLFDDEALSLHGLKPQPVPPLGTKIRIMQLLYVTNGYYHYGYCAEVI